MKLRDNELAAGVTPHDGSSQGVLAERAKAPPSRAPLRRLAVLLAGTKGISLAVESAIVSIQILPLVCVLATVALLLFGGRARSGFGAIRRWGLVAWACAMTLFIAGTVWVELGLAARDGHPRSGGGARVWSTRGLVLEGPEIGPDGTHNSIDAIALAFERGARGVEVDVYYDPALGDFVVSHDRPYIQRGGKLLMLGDLMSAVGAQGAYWLDWKKLRHLSRAELDDALELLGEILRPGDLKSRFYIEGEDPFHLSVCRRAGFLTIYDTHPIAAKAPFSSVVIDFYKAVYYFGGFTVLSLESGATEQRIYVADSRDRLSRIPLFLYHVPLQTAGDEAYLDAALSEPNLQVVILRDHSRDLYQRLPH